MKLRNININYFLSIALAVTFFANSLSAFFTPDEFTGIIKHALFFNKVLYYIPFFVIVIGFNDLLVCILLISRQFTKATRWWTVIWISFVILVFIAQLSLDGIFTALEHSAPLGIALYLALSKQTYLHNSQREDTHL